MASKFTHKSDLTGSVWGFFAEFYNVQNLYSTINETEKCIETLPVAPESRALQKGTRLPFGLPNTPATFLKSKWTKTIKQKIKGLKPFRYRTKKRN